MNNNMLMSKEDSIRDSFNSSNFNYNETEYLENEFLKDYFQNNRFILYFVQLLHFALKLNIITKDACNFIVTNLISTIEKEVDGNTILVSNYLYIITIYLKTMSNYDAWIELKNLKSKHDAKSFLTRVSLFYGNNVEYLIKKLASITTVVGKLESIELSNDLVFLRSFVNDLKICLTDSSVNLKDCHSTNPVITYNFLFTDKSADNYIDRIISIIDQFHTEICMLEKLNAKEVFKQNYKQTLSFSGDLSYEDDMDKELEKLKAKYKKKLEKSEKAQEEFDKKITLLEENFQKEHSDLSEEEYEKAFDEYFDNLDDSIFGITYEDSNSIDSWYQYEKNSILEKYSEIDRKQEKRFRESITFSDNLQICSLKDFILEYGLFALASNGEIIYPQDNNEKIIALDNLDISKCIKLFLKHFKDNLSDLEVSYLEIAQN